jgi:hypothetical protein
MTETVPGPSGAGSVVLEVGAGTGALVLHTPADLAGQEIEISPASGGPAAHRTHSLVRERITSAGTSYAAVYPGVAAGDYTLWRDDATPAAVITINGGQVTCYRWPDSPEPAGDLTSHGAATRDGSPPEPPGSSG